MSAYILQGEAELERLNEQSQMESYSLEKELSKVNLKRYQKILDAGCGSGVFAEYVLERKIGNVQIDGCDISKLNVDYLNLKYAQQKFINFFDADLVNDAPRENHYDFVFNRLVLHHLSRASCIQFLENCKKSLNSNGEILIVDLDGLFMNMGTINEVLMNSMNKVKNAFSGDLNNFRYVPKMLENLGFKRIETCIEVVDFQGEERKREILQWRDRFESSLEFYKNVFGGELLARQFFREYIRELEEGAPFFYNKFIIHAKLY